MALHRAEAFVLSVTDLQEADRIVEFLALEQGRRRGVARGAKRRFSRFAGELQPLARVRVEWFEKEGRDLVRISSVERAPGASPPPADLDGLLVGAYLAETAATFAPEGESAATLYRLLDATVSALAAGGDRRSLVRYFESWVLRLSGIFPPPDTCPSCGASLAEGAALLASGESLVCRRCAREAGGGAAVSPEAVAFWLRIGRESPARVAHEPPPRALLDEVGEVVGRIRRHFLGHELRSLDVLRRTLGTDAPA